MSRKERRAREKQARTATRNPRGARLADAIGVAVSHLRAGRLAEAEKLCERILAAAPNQFETMQILAIVSSNLGKLDRAIEWFATCSDLRPDDAQAHFNLGNALDEVGRPADAEACYRRALAIDPRDAQTLVNLGNALSATGRQDEAVAAYRQATELAPRLQVAFNNLGSALGEIGAFDEALAAYRKAVAIDDSNARTHANLGVALHENGELEDAAAHLERAVALDPQTPAFLIDLGRVLADLGRLEEALSRFDAALAQDPTLGRAAVARARALRSQDRMTEAVETLDRAIAADPGNVDALCLLSSICLAAGDTPRAIAAAATAVRQAPEAAAAHYCLGTALNEDGQFEAAAEVQALALARDPDFVEAYNNRGVAFLNAGRLGEARECLEAAIARDSDYGMAHFNLFPLVYREDEPGPAIAAMERAVAADPYAPRAVFLLGVLRDQSGDAAEAERLFLRLPRASDRTNPFIDSWNYVKESRGPATRLPGSAAETLRLALDAATASGLVLEFGVRHGNSLRAIAAAAGQAVHGFDSFEGLPESWHGQSKQLYSTHGALPSVPDNVELHVGLFHDTLPGFAAAHAGPIRFLHVDCDIYSSTRTIFEALGNRIVPGTVILFDEYFMNPYWREDEYRAFQEACEARGWEYEYLAFCLFSGQAAVRIL